MAMSVGAPPFSGSYGISPYPVRRFTVDEYHQLIQAGILTEDDPVELLEGWIVPKMPRGPAHDTAIELTNEALRSRLPTGWRVRVQSAITTIDSEPEPDLAIVRGSIRNNLGRHPGPEDIGVAIEVVDASLGRDRKDKGRLFARAGIVCYWIVNLTDRLVEVYTDPSGADANAGYRQRRDYGIDDAVPLVLDGQERAQIPVAEMLP
jgi:hypothetical protein